MTKHCSEAGFCAPLLDRLQRSKTQGKGFVWLANPEPKNGVLAAYLSGRADKGKFLNFCPFCGFSFLDLRKQGKGVRGDSFLGRC